MSKFENSHISLSANALRGLAMDAIQAANSGHPGLPMGMADVAAVLWTRFLRHDPKQPAWPDRDRFVLSGGHGSMLLYGLLHMSGYDLSLDDLKKFRQLGSRTPGHPERGHTPGVEVTTGPLGQGFANAVGMAIAERMLAARFNTEESALFDHTTWVFCGDGDLMEGISHEAGALAGHLKLDRLVAFYDSNSISIEGSTALAHTEDVAARFKAYGWNVERCDGHDVAAIDRTIRRALRNRTVPTRRAPTLIICTTVIGKGSPNKAGTAKVHGEPLGAEELLLAKRALGLSETPFDVNPAAYEPFAAQATAGHRRALAWGRMLKERMKDPAFAALWKAHMEDAIPDGLAETLPSFEKPTATRAASGTVLQSLARALPQLVGGSADLAPSNKTWLDDFSAIAAGDFSGKNIHFGVRELGMAAIQNGMLAHGGLRVFSATFFVFSDYVRPALRIAALSRLPAIYVFTHDSFYVGEDGPTHEPVEHIAALRAIPNVTVIRPADPTETAAAWIAALENRTGPTALLLTRQNLEVLDRSVYPAAANVSKGAYTLWQAGTGTPDIIVIATGSEVQLALRASRNTGANVRVVSMPSWELFEAQPAEYRNSVLPPACRRRLVIEAGSSFGWARYAGDRGILLTLDRFGASGPYKDLERQFGFTDEAVANALKRLLRDN